MAFLSRVYHNGDGGTAGFNVPFGYLSQSHVEVYVDDVLKTEGAGNHYTWTSPSTITFTAGNEPGAGTDNILFKRVTPKATRNVDFQDASSLTEAEMDEDSNQLFYIAQEAFDEVSSVLSLTAANVWDAESKRIINVGTPTASTDAATKAYADSISAAAGNVPTPGDPGEDDYILKASGGNFAWTSPANIRTALGLAALALKATIDDAALLDANVVTTAKIIDDAVTLAKIASGTAGDILYWDGSGNPAALAKGTNGQYLTLSGGLPAWAPLAGSGWEFVETSGVISGSPAAVEFHDLDTGYDHLFVLDNIGPATDSVTLYLRTSPDTGGTPTFDTGVSDYEWTVNRQDSTTGAMNVNADPDDSEVHIIDSVMGNTSTEVLHGLVEILNPGASGVYQRGFMNSVYGDTADGLQRSTGAFTRQSTGVVSAVQFLWSSGNFANTGSIRHYRRSTS